MDINHELSRVAVSIVEKAKQRRAQEEAQDVAQQKQAGSCSLIPFPQVATQPFRSDLVLDRHPLFVVNVFKDDCFIHERTVEHPESGEPIVQRVGVQLLPVPGQQAAVVAAHALRQQGLSLRGITTALAEGSGVPRYPSPTHALSAAGWGKSSGVKAVA